MLTSQDLRGRINDADSHEMIPANLWGQYFGDIGAMLSAMLIAKIEQVSQLTEFGEFTLHVERDEIEITPKTVWLRAGWEKAGPRAPGAIDMNRRIEVLDVMGVRRQLLFPSFGLVGMVLAASPITLLEDVFGGFPPGIDPDLIRHMGRAVFGAWNDWAIEQQKLDPDRLRIVAVTQTEDFDDLMAETERVIDGGIRALWIPASTLPGGKSPAHRDCAPFWKLCEETNTVVLLHLAFEEFMRTSAWRRIPEFEVDTVKSAEFIADPWCFATGHMPPENYLTTLILGGVFERHPDLRFGVIECGAYWVGPMAENLDNSASLFKRRMSKTLSMPPSAYLPRNVRTTPYWFEPVATYVDRYGLEDVWVYGSDYPHMEGGVDQLNLYIRSTAPAGDTFMEKFFVTNSELIMPSLELQYAETPS